MSKLSFDVTLNSSEFIEKTELIRSAIQATALEMEKQARKIGLAFDQMADDASITTEVIGTVIKRMQEQINAATASLYKLDMENQARLKILQTHSDKSSGKEIPESRLSEKSSSREEMNSREGLSAEIEKQSKELEELNAELLNYQQKIAEIQSELLALRTEMTSVSDEMKEMREAGEENTETYAELEEKSVALSDALKNTKEHVSKIFISDDSLEGMLSGLEGISGGFSAATSALELFSLKSEFLEGVLQKVQLAIEVVNGLQEVNAMLSEKSAFQINIVAKLKLWWRNIVLQAAAAQGVETAAASAGTVVNVNLGLAGSFRAIGLAIKSIPVIGWILAGISALISLYSLWSSRTKEQQEKQEEMNKSVQEFNEKVQNNAAKPIAMIELLSIKFKALGNDIDAQKKFIADNKKAFDELGMSITNVEEAQQLLIDNKDKFIKAQIDKAISLAYTDKMQDEAKKLVEAQTAADSVRKERGSTPKEETETINNIPLRKGKQPVNVQEFEMYQFHGMLDEEGFILTQSEIKERAYLKQVEEHRKNIEALAGGALEHSMEADKTLAEITPEGKKTNSGKGSNTGQVKEAHKKLMEIFTQQYKERLSFVKDSENKIRQAEIDALAEGPEKTLAQMDFNHEKEIEKLKQEEKDLKRQRIEEEKAIFDAEENIKKAKDSNYEKEEFNPTEIELTVEEEKDFATRMAALHKKQMNERAAYYASERQAMNEYLKEYGSYEEKRRAILELGESRKKGKKGGEQKLIDEDTKKALAELDVKAAETSKAFSNLFSGAKDRTVKDLRTIAAEAQKALDFIEKGDWDAAKGAEFGLNQDSFNAIKDSPEELDKIKQSIQGIVQQADASDSAFNKMGNGFKKLFEAGSDSDKVTEALAEIEGVMNEVMQVAQFLSGCLSQLGDAFGNGTLSGIAEGMNVAMDAANSAMSGATMGNAMFGPWGAAAGAAIGLVSSLGSSLAKLHDAKHEKKIKKIQDQIEVLEKTYDNLGDSLDTAFSSDASALIEQQNTLLEQQKVLIQNQIEEEKSKKKTDWDRIKDWENQIDDINKVMDANNKKKIDVIFGEDVQSAIENFAQAYADAWNAGDDRAKTSKELVKNMIKQMIMEAIKSASSKPMEQLREKLAGFFSDGIISAWEQEQIEKDAEELMRSLDQQFAWGDKYMKEDDNDSSSSDSSSQKGFAAMSQDTGEELNGRFTALQISNEEIKNSMFLALSNLSSLCTTSTSSNLLLGEMRNLAVMSNSHLEDISKYTKVMTSFGEKLDNIAYNTKSLTSR